jgi:hypothetical protein
VFAAFLMPPLQLTRLASGTQQVLDKAGGYFPDPALQLRYDELCELAPQHVIAGILQDAAHSSMLRLGAQLAAVARRRALQLLDPEAPGGPSEPSKSALASPIGHRAEHAEKLTGEL